MNTPSPVPVPVPRLPVTAQHALVFAAVVCSWIAVPRPTAPPGAWMWDVGGLVMAVSLVLTRRRQPHIDDRDLDRILGFGGLLTAAWIVVEWDVSGHPFASGAAATTLALGCMFWTLGTRETCWALPAAPAPLLGAVPALGSVPAGTVGLVLCLLVAAVVLIRRGPAPQEQLDPIHSLRLIVPALAALAVLLLARGWFL